MPKFTLNEKQEEKRTELWIFRRVSGWYTTSIIRTILSGGESDGFEGSIQTSSDTVDSEGAADEAVLNKDT